ncbi:hypothetical protein [Paraburkholderia sediminicola]|uniref:hypothetical protein n=1 Tax=Paraburkholderia sediminicola TaxID=458836 RepID=UPI0038BAEF32
MQGKTFFLNRFISRSSEWQCRYPGLGAAWQNARSLSDGRQVVAATADADGIRCVFFSSLGSVLDFSASWAELASAKTWWYFTIRWNFWLMSDEDSLVALRTAGYDPTDRKIGSPGTPVNRRCEKSFEAFLDYAEALFRQDCGTLLSHTARPDQNQGASNASCLCTFAARSVPGDRATF